MVNPQLEHVPLALKLEITDLLGPEDDSDETDESDISDDETSLVISSDEEAELEAQRIHFHELLRRNLFLRERGHSTSSSGSSVMIMNEKSTDSSEPLRNGIRKRYKKRTYSSASMASTATPVNEMESCGNIFAHYAQSKLTLNCSFCDIGFGDIQTFSEHLNDSHQLFSPRAAPETNQVTIQPKDGCISQHGRSVSESSKSEKTLIEPLQPNVGSRPERLRKGVTKIASATEGAVYIVQVKEEPCHLKETQIDFGGTSESCGNIFILNRQKLVLTCGHCQCKYATLELFRKHLRQQHHLLEEIDKDTLKSNQKLKSEDVIIVEEHTNTTKDSSLLIPMVAIPGDLALDNHDLLPIASEGSNSCSSVPHTSLERFSAEISTKAAEENGIKAQQKQTVKQRRRCRKLISPKLSNRIRRKAAASPAKTVEQTRLRRKCANIQKSKDYNKQSTESSSESNTSERQVFQESVSRVKDRVVTAKRAAKKKTPTVLQCDLCLKTFTKVTRLNDHKRVHTGEKPYKCNVCGKQFRIKMRLVEHALRHRKEKAFKCDICGHAVATRQDLTLHQRHHNGDKRYRCTQCSKAFVRGSDLKIHARIHTGEKPFKCEVCQKAFRANQNLIVHRKTHQSQKEFKCEYCDKCFMRNIDRKVHHRTHTGEKPFKCEICGRGYSSRFHVRTHIGRDHLPGPPRPRRKPGPKPKHIKEELERQKKLNQELEEQVNDNNQQQPAEAYGERNTFAGSKKTPRKLEQVSPEETMHHVSLALKIALEDDYEDELQKLENGNDAPTLGGDVTDGSGLLQEKHNIISTSSRVFIV